jgi:xanthine/CO dehydrogenase XdhC/CoxF family maturation factor
MLVTEHGDAVGAISGGCLEKVMRAHALESLDREPHIVVLDTTRDTDLIFGHGLGCPGRLHFLVEPFSASPPESLTARIMSRNNRERLVVITLLPEDGAPLQRITLPLDADAAPGSSVVDQMKELGRQAAESRFIEQGAHSFFIEVIEPPLRLLLIGAGLDVAPFVRVAESVGLDVKQIVKSAAALQEGGSSTDGGRSLAVAPEKIGSVSIDRRTAVVVMTHNYLSDLDYLRALLPGEHLYLAVIGSRGRFQKLIEDLASEGFTSEQLRNVRGPAGLDIGAETPSQIALSIVAEIQATVARKRVGELVPSPGRNAVQ